MDKFVATAGPIGTVLNIGGQLRAGRAAEAYGEAQQRLAEYQATQLRQNAKQAEAVGIVNARDKLTEAELLMSRAQAVAAASGGGALDPTVLNLIGGIAEKGKLNAEMEIFNAKETARGLRDEARGASYSGNEAARAVREYKKSSKIGALATAIQGAKGFSDMIGVWKGEKKIA